MRSASVQVTFTSQVAPWKLPPGSCPEGSVNKLIVIAAAADEAGTTAITTEQCHGVKTFITVSAPALPPPEQQTGRETVHNVTALIPVSLYPPLPLQQQTGRKMTTQQRYSINT